MRYRSRLRRQRMNSGTKKNLIAAAVIIIFAIIVFSIGAIGDFLAKNIFVPLFGDAHAEANTPTAGTSPNVPIKLTESVQLSDLSMYMVQMNAYSEQDDAEASAQSIKERGGAGYIIQDEYYRVFAAAYNTEDQAQSVCEQLIEQDEKNAKVYPVSSGTVVFKITATREQIDTVSEAFAYFPEMCGELAEQTINFDKGALSTSQYKTLAANIANNLEDLADSINRIIAGTSENEVLKSYSQLLDNAREMLEKISIENSDSALAFSSEIKYNYIELAHMYIQYVASVNG